MPNFNTNQRLNGLEPLSYMGVNPQQPPNFVTKMGAPGVNDSKNLQLGTIWLDMSGYPNALPTADDIYMLVALVGNQATWVPFGGGDMETLTGDTGGPVSPTAGNINTLGTAGHISVTGNPGTSTLTWDVTGDIADQYPTDSGTATPAGNVLNVFGGTAGRDINTSALGNTINIDLDNAITLGDLANIPAGVNAITLTTGDIVLNSDLGPANGEGVAKIKFWPAVSGQPYSDIYFYLNNVFIGALAGNQTMTPGTAIFNIGIGPLALNNVTDGAQNICVGNATGNAITTGNSNVAMGYTALSSLDVGTDNVAIGDASLANLVGGVGNTSVGDAAGGSLTGNESFCTLLGIGANGVTGLSGFIQICEGGFTFIHNYPGASSANGTNIFIGEQAGNFTLASGFPSGNVGNIGIGGAALNSLQNSVGGNISIGDVGMIFVTTGVQNTGIGKDNFTAAGVGGLITGSYNTALGFNAGSGYRGAESSNILIGHSVGGTATENNTLRIGVSTGTGIAQVNRCFIAGIRGITTGVADAINVLIDSTGQLGTVSSSIRYKTDVKDMSESSDKIHSLRPVTFTYKEDETKKVQYGLIAEEVKEVMPDLVVNDTEGEVYSVKYHDLVPMLLNEVQKLKKEIQEMKKNIV